MADRANIADLIREGQRFDETFLLADKELRTTRSGKLFVQGTLQDRTGQCRMVIWEATEKFYEALPRGGFVRARGRVELYQNRPQLIIEACIPVDEREVEMSDFLPATSRDVAQMEAELRTILTSVADPAVAAVLRAFLDDAATMEMFRKSPAATVNHHAYLGGLLEHTLGILRAAEAVLPLYPVLNRDLLLAGIFLHDIGKTVELSCDREFAYTDAGRLVGHLVQGVLMLTEKVAQARAAGADVPDIVVRQIEHMILAHHGEYEFGSPKLPMTAEAVALHFLDNLDAKITAFAAAVASHPADEDTWTTRQFMFDNQMLFRGTEQERIRRRGELGESANGESDRAGRDADNGQGRLPLKGGLS